MNNPKNDILTFRNLNAYQAAFLLQQTLFRYSREWPKIESYSLIDQIRRSSRSIGANLAEAWGKRRYPAHFLSKLTDADGELQETRHWIFTAEACGYLSHEQINRCEELCDEVGRMLGSMQAKHESFCLK
jgi:four helix bundle protein